MQRSEGCVSDENRNLVYIAGIVSSNESSCVAHRIEVPGTGRVKIRVQALPPKIAWLWHLRQIEALFDLTECWEKLGTKGDILRQITSKRLTICDGPGFSPVEQHLIREHILSGYAGRLNCIILLKRGPIFALSPPADLPNLPGFKHLSSPTFWESEGVQCHWQWFPEGGVKCICFLIHCVVVTSRLSRLQSEYGERGVWFADFKESPAHYLWLCALSVAREVKA